MCCFLFGETPAAGGDDLSVSRQQRLPAPLQGSLFCLPFRGGGPRSGGEVHAAEGLGLRIATAGVRTGFARTEDGIEHKRRPAKGTAHGDTASGGDVPPETSSARSSPGAAFGPRDQVSRLGILLLERLPIPHGEQWLRSFVRFTVTGIVRNFHPLPSALFMQRRRSRRRKRGRYWILVEKREKVKFMR